MTDQYHPLLKAQTIQDKLEDKAHVYNQQAKIKLASLGDMVGMSEGTGISYAKIPPGGESTVSTIPNLGCTSRILTMCSVCIHYHLTGSEWVYILKGNGVLRLLDASLAIHSRGPNREEIQPGHTNANLEVTETAVGPGDFAGFPGGVEASKWAHSLKAGDEGMEYLMGGTRDTIDVCSYPQVNKTVVYDSSAGKDRCSATSNSGDPVPAHLKK